MATIEEIIATTNQLLAAATPGPWTLINFHMVADADRNQIVAETKKSLHSEADAALIAHARTGLEAMVLEVERLQEELLMAELMVEGDGG